MMLWWCFVSFILFLLSSHEGWIFKERDKKRNPLFSSNLVRYLGTPFLRFGELWCYWYFSLAKLASPRLAQMLLLRGGLGLFWSPIRANTKTIGQGAGGNADPPPLLLLTHTLNACMSARRIEMWEKNMGGGGVRDILSNLIEYLRITESTNEKAEPRERTGKRFRSSGRKVPSFSPPSLGNKNQRRVKKK